MGSAGAKAFLGGAPPGLGGGAADVAEMEGAEESRDVQRCSFSYAERRDDQERERPFDEYGRIQPESGRVHQKLQQQYQIGEAGIAPEILGQPHTSLDSTTYIYMFHCFIDQNIYFIWFCKNIAFSNYFEYSI